MYDRSHTVCVDCPALCCKDLAIPTKRPRTRDQIDEMKWYLHFDTVSAIIVRRRWYLLINGRCMHLDDNDLCTIYEDRSYVCRQHNPPECERFSEFCEILIETPDELEQYLKPKADRPK